MKKILIIGAGVAGTNVADEIKKNKDLELNVVGFVDDDFLKLNKKIGNIKILGNSKNLSKIIKKNKIDEVIIAIPSAAGESISNYVKILSESKVDFRIVPRVKEIIEGKAHIKSLRKVSVEDILGRPVIKADVEELKKFLKEKTIVVTGAAGSIGSELSRQIAAYKPKKLILIDRWENGVFEIQKQVKEASCVICDIKEENKVNRIFKQYKPDFVFHAAAYKHVPLMEENPDEAVKNNVLGTLSLAKIAVAYKVKKFVIVSTDKAADPVNVMGATKLITETIGRMFNGSTKFVSVRFGNVLDSFGSVVPIFRKQIEEGGPITITDKRMTRYFMTIPEATQLILKAASIGIGGELFVLDMGSPIKIVDLANNMIRLSGYIPGKDIKVVEIGIRPGEKLHEKLFHKTEELSSTKLEKIFVTKSSGIDIKKMSDFLRKIKKYSLEGDVVGIRREFAKVISGFPKK